MDFIEEKKTMLFVIYYFKNSSSYSESVAWYPGLHSHM